MSGGGIAKIGEMALIGMAAPEVATMFASDAAPAAIASDAAPAVIDATASGAGGIGSLTSGVNLGSVTGSDLSAAYDLPGTLPGSPVATPEQLANSGINQLPSGFNTRSITNAVNYDPTGDAADAANAYTSRELPASVQSQLTANAASTSAGGTAAANPYTLSAPGTNTLSGINPAGSLTPGMGATAPANALTSQLDYAGLGTNAGSSPSMLSQLINWAQNNPGKAAAMGLAPYLFNKMATPNYLPGYTPPSAASYGLGRTLAAGYQPVRPMAGGGLTVGAGSVPTQGVAPSDLMQKPNQGAGLDSLAAQYGISPQMVSQARQTYGFSAGGPTEMAVGGKLLSGHGDGMSDSIKANISGSQEARLGDGEFVVPADVVSHLGNGSTDAGAKQLYSMMDKVRKARTGRKAQGRQINPQQYMPA